MQKILIIEDDDKLRQELAIFLERNGFETAGLEKYNNAMEDMMGAGADLILLDINLPDADGEYILKEFRKVSDIPVIMITSRDSELDELLSMHYGADHYVTKPFNPQILLAKIVAVLKRSGSLPMQEKISCGQFVLNLSKSRMETEEKQVELTNNELRIMKCLIKNRGNIVSREAIMNDLWDSEAFIDDNTLTVNMTRIRKKLEELGLQEMIVTKRGQGYMLSEGE